MRLTDVVSFAGRNITQKKTQSFLTIIGVVIGILAIVSLISLGFGVQNYITSEITTIGANVISVLPSQNFGGPAVSKNFNDNDVSAVRNVRGVEEVVAAWFGSYELEYRDQSHYGNVLVIEPSKFTHVYSKTWGYEPYKGRWIEDSDKYSCMIGYALATNSFDREIDIGDKITINDKKYKVIGILEETGNPRTEDSVILSKDVGEELFEINNEYNMMIVSVRSGEDVNLVSEEIKDELEDSRGDENFSVLTAEQLAESISSIFSVLTIFLVGVAGISLLVGAVGISNTMHMSILERRKDIGILKALGAENTTILSIFVVEAGFLGLFGGIVGTILGILIAKAIEYVAAISGYGLIRAWISWELIVGVLVFSFVVGILSGYFPARSGAKLNPVDTLRGE
ncbi:putative ABC transport system permease protein [Methanococcus maripaludis]|uniref:Putative ABC transport system permease protein n=1 Tax=Methanococcus maripaludis TaxID=39152 RepID=A0A7J9P4P3_METMI|nr:ABC transporter permease [Methanococcus maripaludis]MBA2858165.1 putative ABC transport system permease protein [Methanococcus maripaludis]